ncbi:MAG: hypothetical protein ACON4Z_02420 [Planctomycetota bacterium]
MAAHQRSDRAFAARAGQSLIALMLLGFGGRALVHGDSAPPPLRVLLPHVATVVAWYVLFVLQAASGARRRRRHRLLGYASLPLVLAMLSSGVAVMAANYRLKGDAPLAFFNLLNLSQFFGLYTAALLSVRRPRQHARLMLYASFAMMPPALVRIVQAVGLPEPVTVLLIVGLWIPGIRHDRATLGRVHPATWWGVAVITAGLVLGGPVGFSAAWAALIERAAGAG